MTWTLLAPFLLAAALSELTPGPNMGYLALVAARWGRRAGLAVVVGVTLGLAAYMVAAVGGLAQVATAWPWTLRILRWAGVAYLLWLAWDAWRGEDGAVAELATEPPQFWRLAGRGLAANLLNPKAAVFYLALLPGFTDPHLPFAPQALLLGSLHLFVAVVVHTTIVLVAAGARPAFSAWTVDSAVVRKGFALGLAAIAVWLAWETRTPL